MSVVVPSLVTDLDRELVAVAVPLPLRGALTYAVPAGLRGLVTAGSRVRVQVGKRRLVGVVLAEAAEPLATGDPRPIDELIDAEPLVGPQLLELASFIAGYYLAPIGEVLRAMVPSTLPPWGDRSYWLTDAGALAPPRSPVEASLIEALRELGRCRGQELVARIGGERGREVVAALDRLVRDRRVTAADSAAERGSGARYLAAVELAPGEVASHLATAGRSTPARALIDHLAALGRPATVEELADATGASSAVVRRLVQLGVLRRFTQIASLGLDRHRLAARGAAPAFELRPDQQQALDRVVASLQVGGYAAYALHGVTGSGKTEVFLRAAEAALALGKTAIVMVPEIALVPALAREVVARFAGDCAILHSNLSTAERIQEWQRVRRGAVKVVVGPRSAIFAPLLDLGLVVVDEEQDSAYKQESTPRYSGRDLALVRASQAGAVVLLASATPSLETRANVDRGKIEFLTLTTRVGQGALPEGILVDLRAEPLLAAEEAIQVGATGNAPRGFDPLDPTRRGSFSARLRQELAATLAAGDQAILFRNRRGYAPVLLCRACGEEFRCDDCGVPRTWHRREGRLLCHYCGSHRTVTTNCPACGEGALEAVGSGTERVEEELADLFPGVTYDVLDRDAVRRVGGPASVLERFSRGDAQVLIGTQMVSKGHHFPRVALTAVLSADSYLSFPDFRAVERTYNLLVQLAGRAGRGEKPGKVVIQTFHPDHYAIQAALRHDDAGFAAEEMRFRRVFLYPPYTRMVQLLWSDRQRARGEQAMFDLAGRIRAAMTPRDGIRIAGPAPAPLERLRGEWRFQLLVRATSRRALERVLQAALPTNPPRELVVDVDPQSLL